MADLTFSPISFFVVAINVMVVLAVVCAVVIFMKALKNRNKINSKKGD